MELIIVNPEETHTYQIAWLEAHTISGSFVILPNHAPTILILEPGRELTFGLKSGKQDSITVQRGVIEVTRKRATLIINKPLT